MRKSHLVAELEREHEVLSSKARFIRMVISEELQVKNRPRAKLVEDLRSRGFRTLPEILGDAAKKATGDDEAGTQKPSGFDYLLGMRLWGLTAERVEDIEKQLREKKAELDALRHTAVEDLWDRDLDAILAELERSELAAAKAQQESDTAGAGKRRSSGVARGTGKRPKSGSAGGANAPPLPPALPLARRGPDCIAEVLQELQGRHLSKTHVARPGLFTDVVGEALAHAPAETRKRASTSGKSGGPAGSPSKSPKASEDSGSSTEEVAESPPAKKPRVRPQKGTGEVAKAKAKPQKAKAKAGAGAKASAAKDAADGSDASASEGSSSSSSSSS